MTQSILIIEDDPVIAGQLVRALESKGYTAFVATDGDDGIARFSEINPALLIVETILPKQSGAEICVYVRSLEGHETTPILLLGPVDSHRSLRHYSFGTGLFLAKPFKSGELWSAIELLLSRNREPDIEIDDLDPLERAALARTASDATIPTDGAIEGGKAFALLLLDMFQGGLTGIMHLNKNTVEKRIFFLNGLPVNADSNLRGEELLSILRDRARISSDVAMHVESEAHIRGQQARDVLLAENILSHRELYRWMRLQARDRVVNCFGWDHSTYHFEPTNGFIDAIPVFEFNPIALIDDGIDRFYDPDDIMIELYKARDMTVRATERLLGLLPLAQLLFQGVDFAETFAPGLALGDILHRIPMDPVTCQRRVKALLETGLIELVPVGAHRASPMADVRLEAAAAALRASSFSSGAVVGGTGETDFELWIDESGPGLVTPSGAVRSTDAEVERLLADHLRTSTSDAYRILDVAPDAALDELERSRTALLELYSPENLALLPTVELRAKGKEIHERVAAAYRAVGTGDARREFDKDRAAHLAVETTQVSSAPLELHRGIELLAALRWADAERAFKQMVAEAPNEPLFRIYMAWSRFNLATDAAGRQAGALLLRTAVDELPDCDIGYQFLGLIAKRDGDNAAAEAMFQKALSFNPKNSVALAELGFSPLK